MANPDGSGRIPAKPGSPVASAPWEQPAGGDSDGTFIEVEVADEVKGDAELAKKLEEVCPVDIYRAGESGVEIVRPNLDECVLCELCLDASPPGTVVVRKLYDNTELRR